ncbi:antibiotic biosynthesis monooxygenase [Sphingorhabdus sp. EL138]|uniref:antibiotic biosynthesis monooxygenase family protein n=1 Tax=Sphingorhabdus sp. EL138 TaxID=2073156 RepID=UPI0025E6E65B|nr:antibiotic biosynthesis monooxygenase [Sphingorhabdus sp. EL138]
MIIEHALLSVRQGEELAFEAAMVEAKPLISASPGFVSIEVRPAVVAAGTYLLHRFYDPMPSVSYFGDPL